MCVCVLVTSECMAIVLMSECMQIYIFFNYFLVKSECIPNVCCCLFCLFLVLFLERVGESKYIAIFVGVKSECE